MRGEIRRVGSVGALEGLDRLYRFSAQDTTFVERAAVVAWTAAHDGDAAGSSGGGGGGRCGGEESEV